MGTIKQLAERREKLEAELREVKEALAIRAGETDADEEVAAGGETGGDYEAMTKAELQAELDSRGIAYNANDTKSDLLDRLAE